MSDNVDYEACMNKDFLVPDDTELCRYMTLEKYVIMLQKSELHFHYAKDFEDKFEGTMPESFLSEFPDKIREQHKKMSIKFNKSNKTYISCWNKSRNESYALWKIYCNCQGICVKTTKKKLENALNNENIKIFKVEYIDLKNKDIKINEPPIYFGKPGVNRRLSEAFKSFPYEYEDEVRAIYIEPQGNDYGKNFHVNLGTLMGSVITGPIRNDKGYY
mgnify:FL=1